MMDKFFTQKLCSRCKKPLDGGRIMSMYNTDCICMDCKQKECHRPDYAEAVAAELNEVRKGNFNYKGIKG